jgi:hypothetical protein
MGNIGDPISTSVPTVGTSGPAYAATINELMDEVKARLEAKIPYSSLVANSAMNMNGQAITNVGYLTFVNGTVSPAASPSSRVEVYNGDFWFISEAGAIQITAGTALAAASLGGIEGDYGGVNPAKMRYNAAGQRFEAYHDYSTTTWARYRGYGVDIAAGATSANMAQLRYSGGSTLTFNLPTTLAPAGTSTVLTIDDAGAMGVGSVTGKITFTGTGDIAHPDKTVTISGISGFASVGTISRSAPSSTLIAGVMTAGATAHFELSAKLNKGDRIKAVKVWFGTSADNPTLTIVKQNHATGAAVASSVSGGPIVSTATSTCTITTPTALVAGDVYQLKISTLTDGIAVHTIEVVYDRP